MVAQQQQTCASAARSAQTRPMLPASTHRLHTSRPRHAMAAAHALPACWRGCTPPVSSSRQHAAAPRRAAVKLAAAIPDTLVTQQQDNSSELSVDFLGVVNDMQTARGIVHTPISPDHVYDLLSNYDQCPRVFRSVGSSQTLQNEAGGKQVLQTGKWQFLLFKGTFNVRLDVVEDPGTRTIVFTLAESSFMRNFEGRWQIHALPGGGTCAEYVLAVQPLLPIPAAVAPYTSGIFKKQVSDLLEDLLEDLQSELSRQVAAGAVEV